MKSGWTETFMSSCCLPAHPSQVQTTKVYTADGLITHSAAIFCYAYPLLHISEFILPPNMTCLLRNLYVGHEATVRTGHGTTDWFQIGKGVHQGCILSPYSFNLYAEYIMRNVGLDETQAGIKTDRRNINNLRYADDTTLRQKVKRN